MKKNIIRLLFILGLALAPGFYIYNNFISPNRAFSVTLFGRRPGETLADGRLPMPAWLTPVQVKLDPSMNPIRFEVNVMSDMPNGFGEGDRAESRYKVELLKGTDSLWQREWPLAYRWTKKVGTRRTTSSMPSEIYNPVLATFNVREAGEYTLQLSTLNDDHIRIREVNMNAYRNYWEERFMVYIVGCAFLVVGFFLWQHHAPEN